MRLVYFGSGAFGLPTLQKLAGEHDIGLVVTQPDRPAGRNRTPTATPIAQFADARGLDVIKPEDVNQPGVVERIRSVGADVLVVIAFGQKLRAALRRDALAINLHGSLLPKYRGAAPIQWVVINGEKETGISVIELADRMDAGAILGQASTPIDPMETAGELHDKLAAMGPSLVEQVLSQHQVGKLTRRVQDESLATRAPKLSKKDGTACFDRPSQHVRNRIHGLTPWPGCTVTLDKRPLRLARVALETQTKQQSEAGVFLEDMSVACRPGSIRLLEVQPPGGQIMSFRDYCNGHAVRVGSRIDPV
ncbi:MAG: methionyl-tRNA formyltransferase [Phycisphaerales bacterium]|nr:methionyl-tRNA formyltransferase [Phycisphaerales bacterium]MCI0629684.1 methionyl-tRNA formyltransferase [Phycisphaerales bacterium]